MQKPSVVEVAKELLAICRGDGLTYAKVDQLPIVQTLPVVDASMVRNNRHPDDRGAVAMEYVECVARSFHQIGEKNSALVCMSLNIEPISELGLDARIDKYKEENYIQERKTYNVQRDKAFAYLAGRLIALNHSPCDSDADREQEERVRVEEAFRADFDKETLTLLENAWHRICFSHPEENREGALRRMIKSLPGVVAWVGTDGDDPLVLVQAMMRRVLQTEYPRWFNVLGLQTKLFPADALLQVLSQFGELWCDGNCIVQKASTEVKYTVVPLRNLDDDLTQAFREGPEESNTEEADASIDRQGNLPRAERNPNGDLAGLKRSFNFALQILLKVEEAGGWSWIPEPGQTQVAAERPLSHV